MRILNFSIGAAGFSLACLLGSACHAPPAATQSAEKAPSSTALQAPDDVSCDLGCRMVEEERWFEFFRLAVSFSEGAEWRKLLESDEFKRYWMVYQEMDSDWHLSFSEKLDEELRARLREKAESNIALLTKIRLDFTRRALVEGLKVGSNLGTLRLYPEAGPDVQKQYEKEFKTDDGSPPTLPGGLPESFP